MESKVDKSYLKLREHLVEEFQRRRDRNPSYSLRAFSQFLGINDSTLSQILRGKRKLTKKSVSRLSASLGLSFSDVADDDIKVEPITVLESEKAKALSRWYFDAILEMAETDIDKMNPQTVAKHLEVHPIEIQKAIETLRNVGFLNDDENQPKNLIGSSSNIKDPKIEEATAKRYQQDLLELSHTSIQAVPKTQRDHTSLVVAIHPCHLELIRKRIQQCRREILALVDNSDLPKTQIYATQFSAFPLTKKDIEKSKNKKRRSNK